MPMALWCVRQKIQLVMVAKWVCARVDRPFTNPSELTIPRRAIMDPSLRRRVTKSKALPCKNENTIVSEVVLSF